MADTCKKKRGKKDRATAERTTLKNRAKRIARDAKRKRIKQGDSDVRFALRKLGALNRLRRRMSDPNESGTYLERIYPRVLAASERAAKAVK